MEQINLSPSFLSKVYEKGYDYAVGEKLGLFKKDTQPMSDGRLMHCLIAERLGGDPAKYAVSPYDNFRTKEAREWRDSQPDDTPIVSQDKIDTFSAIADRVIKHPALDKHLSMPCMSEQTIEKNINGFNVKGILDLVASDNETKTVIDWKFVSSLVFDSFAKKALYMHYDLQAAVYDFLVEPTNVYFGLIENEAPYRIKLFHCDQSFLDSGAKKFNTAFTILQDNKWREPCFDIKEVDELMSWENYNG